MSSDQEMLVKVGAALQVAVEGHNLEPLLQLFGTIITFRIGEFEEHHTPTSLAIILELWAQTHCDLKPKLTIQGTIDGGVRKALLWAIEASSSAQIVQKGVVICWYTSVRS